MSKLIALLLDMREHSLKTHFEEIFWRRTRDNRFGQYIIEIAWRDLNNVRSNFLLQISSKEKIVFTTIVLSHTNKSMF